MIDYLDLFTTVRKSDDGAVLVWRDMAIYWNAVTQRGELYDWNGLFVTASDNLEALAAEAARWEAGQP